MPPPERFEAQSPQPPAICLLGVRVHILPVDELVTHITHSASAHQRALVAYVNAHGLNVAYEQPALRYFFNEKTNWVFCDGFGVKWGARLAGLPSPHRYTPPDWIGMLCRACIENKLSMYLLGGKEGVAQRAALTLQHQLAGLNIVGAHHGYFDKHLSSAENEAIIQQINTAVPDILLVGFGMPAQEYWLCDNWDRLHASVTITVGALFDYMTGNTWRAPRWMTDHGLEWLGRLMAEPRRLGRRYLVGNPLFLSRVLRQRLGWLHLE
jgi:N-acetylglucosaminyldiphosphoundecaprenol N-acetyl-beta-D-mannosaminyltransferase